MKIATQIILLFYFCECFGQGVSNAYSARALINDNRYAEAIQVIGDCVEVPCLIELGFCYQKFGNFKKSTNYYLQALEANPNNQTTIFQLSQNFERLGNYTKSKTTTKISFHSIRPTCFIISFMEIYWSRSAWIL